MTRPDSCTDAGELFSRAEVIEQAEQVPGQLDIWNAIESAEDSLP